MMFTVFRIRDRTAGIRFDLIPLVIFFVSNDFADKKAARRQQSD